MANKSAKYAREAGADAARNGRPASHNPLLPNDPDHKNWDMGYIQEINKIAARTLRRSDRSG